jgi:NTE family protein
MVKKKQKIGLALGSGSARGWAHIGVIEALTEAGVEIDCVAGTSIGAVVGAVFASGNLDSLKEVVLQFDWKQILGFLDVVFPKSGLIDGKKVTDFLRHHMQEKAIEDLATPFCAVSTNLADGQEVVISKGDLIEAVRASISLPGIFTPVKKDGMVLIDGGLVDPVPVSVVRAMGADQVIAVDLNSDIVSKRRSGKAPTTYPSRRDPSAGLERIAGSTVLAELNKKVATLRQQAMTQAGQWLSRDPMPNIFEVLQESIHIMEARITETRLRLDPPDLLIQPNLGHIKLMEFNRAQEAIDAGYKETMRKARDMIAKQ